MAYGVDLETDSGIALVRLNRPEQRNALDGTMLAQLDAALTETEERDDVQAVIVTGADPAFCAGLDVGALTRPDGLNISELTAKGRPWPAQHHKPWIGAINGVAITGGLELALACDFLLASEQARFADTHARLGILPFWGLTAELPQAVGLRAARLMSLTGNLISAHEAHEWGLVSRVVPHDRLMAAARQLAEDITSNDLAAARVISQEHEAGLSMSAESARDMEIRRAVEWQGTGWDSERMAARIEAVKQRGRAQK